jgi:two-component system sensor histidine kinase TctE
MTATVRTKGSLKRRLVAQLLVVAAILSVVMFLTIRTVAYQVAETSQDNILGASVTAIADELHPESEGIGIDIPYSSISMLGALSDDSVYYRIVTGNLTITGYDDLPLRNFENSTNGPNFYTETYRENNVRIGALSRTITVENTPVEVLVLVAQTQQGQDAVIAQITNTAAGVGIGFFVLAGLLSWIAAHSAIRPIEVVTKSLQRRGPHDLSPLHHPPPVELVPLVNAVNVFMVRLQGAMTRTENFLADAAHRVRTPLATVRTQTEIALRKTNDEENRATFRAIIRAVDESSRSAGQLIDHAMVNFRSSQMGHDMVDMSILTQEVCEALTPTADLKDMELVLIDELDGASIIGDKILLHGALRNLLDNAIKYSPEDSRVTIKSTKDDKFITVEICDEGRGLGGANPAQLSKRFTRGDNVTDVVGSGLGLTIVKDVARVHGGRLVLKPNERMGTCAALLLPYS